MISDQIAPEPDGALRDVVWTPGLLFTPVHDLKVTRVLGVLLDDPNEGSLIGINRLGLRPVVSDRSIRLAFADIAAPKDEHPYQHDADPGKASGTHPGPQIGQTVNCKCSMIDAADEV